MTLVEFERIRSELNALSERTMNGKRPAYTTMSENVLANFDRVGQRTGLSPAMVAYVYFLKHVDALGAYLAGNDSDPEPIGMRVVDIRNYADLIYALIRRRGTGEDPNFPDPLPGSDTADHMAYIALGGTLFERPLEPGDTIIDREPMV